MSHGIARETWMKADANTQKALTYDFLNKIYDKVDANHNIYKEHLGICDSRFHELEKNQEAGRKRDFRTSSIFGVIGGILGAIGFWLKDKIF